MHFLKVCCLSLTSHQYTYVHIDVVVDYLLRISHILNRYYSIVVCFNCHNISYMDFTDKFAFFVTSANKHIRLSG